MFTVLNFYLSLIFYSHSYSGAMAATMLHLTRRSLIFSSLLRHSSTKPPPADPSLCGRISQDRVVRCPYPDVPIPETNVFSHVFGNFDKFVGSSPALVDGLSGVEVSYNEMLDLTSRTSSGLRRLGLQKGDVVTLCSPNSIDYGITFFATMAAGGVVSTCNPTYTANELSYQINNSGSNFVVTTPSLLPTVQEAIGNLDVKKVLIINEDDNSNRETDNIMSLKVLKEDTGSLFNEEKVNAKEDLAVLPYSSGTTGLPKGVMLSHYNIVANLTQITHPEIMYLHQGEPNLGILPFFHIYGMVVILFHSLSSGGKCVVLPKFEPESFLSTLQKYRISTANLVPPIILFLAKHPLVEKYDLTSIRSVFSGAAPLGADVLKEARERTGIQIIRQGYGLTETSPVTHSTLLSVGMNYPASIGVPIQNQSVKIVDLSTGQSLGPQEEGEVCIAGPNIMKGYLNLPDATSKCITDDGWFHTGDIGYYDNNGFFYITDRLKELIKVKGLQVAPAELEGVLQHHPKIADAAVIGVPHERLGEAPRAFVVRRDDSLSEADVMSFVKERLSEHKWLSGGVEFIKEVPKSASGKILRRNLKK